METSLDVKGTVKSSGVRGPGSCQRGVHFLLDENWKCFFSFNIVL